MGDGSDLLRRLEPAVRPSGSPAPAVRGTRPIEHRGFDQLLAEAQNRPVSVPEAAQQRLAEHGVRLDEDQRNALGAAADRAQAAGGERTLMLMDGVGLVVDLRERRVEEVVDESALREGAVTRIDSAVRMETGTAKGAGDTDRPG